MTNEEAVTMLESMKNYFLPTSPMLEERIEIKALDLAISALSKQSASSKQVDKSVIVDFVAFQREWLKTHKIMELNSADEVMTEIFLEETGKAFIDSLGQSGENDEADYFRDTTKKTDEESINKQEVLTNMITLCDGCYLMEHCGQCNPNCLLRKAMDIVEKIKTDSERVSLSEAEKSNSFLKEPSDSSGSEMNCSDVPDIHVGKTDFQPGDKFILELGQERKMFGEFEIAGTDLYVDTDLLEKLTRYEPEKFEIHNDHTDCIWYHYLDDDDDVPNACPSTCSQYRDGWNDAMKYIYCDGKGYQPYTRKAK